MSASVLAARRGGAVELFARSRHGSPLRFLPSQLPRLVGVHEPTTRGWRPFSWRRAGVTSFQAAGAPRSTSEETIGANAPTPARHGPQADVPGTGTSAVLRLNSRFLGIRYCDQISTEKVKTCPGVFASSGSRRASPTRLAKTIVVHLRIRQTSDKIMAFCHAATARGFAFCLKMIRFVSMTRMPKRH